MSSNDNNNKGGRGRGSRKRKKIGGDSDHHHPSCYDDDDEHEHRVDDEQHDTTTVVALALARPSNNNSNISTNTTARRRVGVGDPITHSSQNQNYGDDNDETGGPRTMNDVGDDDDDDLNGGEDINDDDTGWTDAQHEAFVSTVFDIGLKHASPSVVIENMKQKDDPNLTSERVKSKLQKYRSSNNQTKSKQEFMTEYRNFKSRMTMMMGVESSSSSRAGTGTDGGIPMPSMVDNFSGGDLAGYLTYSVMTEKDNKHQHHHGLKKNQRQYPHGNDHYDDYQHRHRHHPANDIYGGSGVGGVDDGHRYHPHQHHYPGLLMMSDMSVSDGAAAVFSTRTLEHGAREYAERWGGETVSFPTLTESEKSSSLGVTLTYLHNMFGSLSSHIYNQREREQQQEHQDHP